MPDLLLHLQPEEGLYIRTLDVVKTILSHFSMVGSEVDQKMVKALVLHKFTDIRRFTLWTLVKGPDTIFTAEALLETLATQIAIEAMVERYDENEAEVT